MKEKNWMEAVADAAGLEMTPARAEQVAGEVGRIRDGVARAVAPSFGFYDEPLHFLSALEDCAEPDDAK